MLSTVSVRKYRSKSQRGPASHGAGCGCNKNTTARRVGEDVEKSEPYAADGSVEWCGRFGKQSGSSSKG